MSEAKPLQIRQRVARWVLLLLVVAAGGIWALIWWSSRPVEARLTELRWHPIKDALTGEPATVSAAGTAYVHVVGATFARSDDGGKTWPTIEVALPDAKPTDAWTSPVFAPKDAKIYALSGDGTVIASEDDGATWRAIAANLPRKTRVERLVASPDTALIAITTKGAVLRTWDDGKSWKPLATPKEAGVPEALVVDPAHPSTILIGSRAKGIFRTVDGGTDWQNVAPPITGAAPLQLIVDAKASTRYWALSGGTIVRSSDGGATWKELTNPAIVQIARDGQNGRMYAVTKSGETLASRDDGAHWGVIARGGVGSTTPIVAAWGVVYGTLNGTVGTLADR